MKQSIGPYHCLANLVNPKYMDKNLNEDEIDEAVDLLAIIIEILFQIFCTLRHILNVKSFNTLVIYESNKFVFK